MAKTTFCDSRGTQELIKVHKWALASRFELRFARPTASVLRVWQLLGADEIFAIYPTLDGARKTAPALSALRLSLPVRFRTVASRAAFAAVAQH